MVSAGRAAVSLAFALTGDTIYADAKASCLEKSCPDGGRKKTKPVGGREGGGIAEKKKRGDDNLMANSMHMQDGHEGARASTKSHRGLQTPKGSTAFAKAFGALRNRDARLTVTVNPLTFYAPNSFNINLIPRKIPSSKG